MRNQNNIFITGCDFERLNELLKTIEKDSSRDQGSIEELKKEIERAEIVSLGKIAGDVVTMNSRVLLKDMDTCEEFSFQIVFPSDADIDAGKISILAPVGTALLGYTVGDIVTWEVPSGMRKLKIKEMLYQPEFEGDLYQ